MMYKMMPYIKMIVNEKIGLWVTVVAGVLVVFLMFVGVGIILRRKLLRRQA